LGLECVLIVNLIDIVEILARFCKGLDVDLRAMQMVKKSNGKWQMYVNYIDLNKVCPKDTYPLPSIDRLVDNTLGYEMLSFLGAYSRYNQIRMYPQTRIKRHSWPRGLTIVTR